MVATPRSAASRRTLTRSILALALLGAACGGAPRTDERLRWYVFREPSGAFAEAARRCSEASEGRYAIEIAALPAGADQQREQLVRRLAAGDTDIDVIGMDVIWTAEFARAGWIRPWDAARAARIREGTLDAAFESGRYAGRLYAAPFTTNVQLLWYRTDLVERPPDTWEAMIAMAERLARKDLPHQVQVQAARYEGFTVWFNTLLASAGGSVLDEEDEAALPREPTRRALAVMARLAGSAAAPPNLSTTREDEARLAFEAGGAAFMLNYTFVWPSARRNAPQIAAKMGWARYPRVQADLPSRVTIGGLNLGVGAFSRHPELALEAAACLRRDAHQVLAATEGGLLPTREALYDHPAVQQAFPFADVLRETLRDAAQRPATPAYHDVSLAIQRTLHPPRRIDADADAIRLHERIDAAVHSRGLL